ncbi:GNAT family N-acetyltransferase [Pseudonocardia broussonetiae]|uniref:GNAT family N-acetyltransferase n=1 Tax=Pseudonocardia broussonetiae TaxID=2736640 RepID=A0A6M6JTH0_9PSEU|nr:GNAT family N-acetyltransferase [Pseudonocardia broussonetiae]QJY51158.1 GNAT family N-acetyltransferase [Pseudonocardia broussonetiae]
MPAVAALAVASELFDVEDAGVVQALLEEFLARQQAAGHRCVVDEVEDELIGVAYYEPVTATDRTWELLMIGVRADRHRQGRGRVLLEHVEHDLRARGQRLLLVETSATAAFDRARAFYLACGYDQEARVRDYFADGDDMVLFRKAVATS